MLTNEQKKAVEILRLSGSIPSAIAKKLGLGYVEVRDHIYAMEKTARKGDLLGFDDSYFVPPMRCEPSYPPRFVRHNELMTLCPI